MNLMLDNLLDLLKEETELYGLVLSAAQGEKDAVIDSNLDELKKIAKEKETLLAKIRIVEKQRQAVTEDLAKSLGCLPHELTLSKLSQRVEQPYSSRMMDRRSELLALTQTIGEVNFSNRELLNHSLELVRSSFLFLNNFETSNTVYHNTGYLITPGETAEREHPSSPFLYHTL